MCIHTSGEVDSFNTHCSALIVVSNQPNLMEIREQVIVKNIWLTFCGHGVECR